MLDALPFASVLILLIGLTCLAPAGLDISYTLHRRTLTTVLIGALLALIGQEWWALGFWAVACWNVLSRPFPAMHLTRLDNIVILFAAYLVGKPLVSVPVIQAVLVTLVTLAPIAYLAGAQWYGGTHYLAQGQMNHADTVVVLSIASACGLAWAWSPWWLLAMAPSVAILVLLPRQKPVRMALIWLWHVALLGLALWSWMVAGALVVMELVALVPLAHRLRTVPDGIDGGRVRIWWILLLGGWWQSGWQSRLLGLGWMEWKAWADQLGLMEFLKQGRTRDEYKQHGTFYSHPHNEYVHLLFEQGAVGLLCVLGWMASLAWSASGTLWGQAVLFPAVAMASTAMTSFPWSFPDERVWGHMGLLVISVVLALLLGGIS